MTLATYQTVIEPKATSDIRGIYHHVAKSSPQGAMTVFAAINAAVASLEQLPHRYEVHESRRDETLTVHSMPVPPYIIYYRVDGATLTVRNLRVRHGARRQPKRFR